MLYRLPESERVCSGICIDRAEIESWMKQNKVETNEELEQRIAANIVSNRIQKGGLK